MKHITLALLFLATAWPAFPQQPGLLQPGLTRYGVEQGLPTDFIKGVVQDSLGFMWLATDDGLVRFDGINAVSVRENIASQYIKGFVRRKNGTVAVVHDMGISLIRYTHGQMHVDLLLEGGQQKTADRLFYPKSAYEDRDGRLWISENERVLCLDGDKLSVYAFSEEHWSDSFQHTFSFAEDAHGQLWVTSQRGGLFIFDKSAGHFTRVPLAVSPNYVNSMVISPDNRLWLGCENGLFVLELSAGGLVSREMKVGGISNLSSLALMPDGRIYGGTWSEGLYEFRPSSGVGASVSKVEGSPYATINSLYVSQGGHLWIAANNGVGMFRETAFQGIFQENTQSFINALAEGPDGVYLSDSQAYQAKYDSLTGKWELLPFYQPDDALVMSMMAVGGEIWMGDNHGFIHVVDISDRKAKVLTLPGERRLVSSLATGPDGSVWACKDGGDQGLYRIYPNGKMRRYGPEQGFGAIATAVIKSPDGSIFASAQGASSFLFKYDRDSDRFSHVPGTLGPDQADGFGATHLAPGPDGGVWLGTTAGLYRHQNGETHKIPLGAAFDALPVKGVALSADGSLGARQLWPPPL